MWQEVFKLAIKNGIWTVLFLAMLIYQLKDSRDRESKYQQTIESLNSSLTVVNDIQKDVDVVKKDVAKVSSKVIVIDKNVNKLKSDVHLISKKINLTEKTN